MTVITTARQRLLEYFDQFDRERPGEFAVAGAVVAALKDIDKHTAFRELRILGRDGRLELVGAPVGDVHELTQVRITNSGRKVGESESDRTARSSILHYIAAHATEHPTRIDAAPELLNLSDKAVRRAIISLAASNLITLKRDGPGLGLVQITARGRIKTTPVTDNALDGFGGENMVAASGTTGLRDLRARRS